MGARIIKARLTKRVVEALKRPEKGEPPVEMWDLDIPGFHIRLPSSGRIVYRYWYRAAGSQRVMTLGRHGEITAEQARDRVRILAGLVADNRDPVAERLKEEERLAEERRRAVTVSQLIDTYLTEGPALNPTKRASSWEYDRSILRSHVEPILGKLQASAVRRVDIERMLSAVRAGKTARDEPSPNKRGRVRVRGGESAGRGAITILRALYNWAMKRDLVASNPTAGVAKPRAVKKERFLSGEEFGRLFSALAEMEAERSLLPEFANAIRLLAFTGARKSEILRLSWSEVDMERGLINLPAERSKTGAKTIVLNAPALAILSSLPRSGGPVFPSPRNPGKSIVGLQKAWKSIRERASLQDVRIHDHRHSFASIAVERGASLFLVSKALTHSQIATTQRYAHLGDVPLRSVTEDVGRAILEAGAPTPANVTPLRAR